MSTEQRFDNILIAFGSESGRAKLLAERLISGLALGEARCVSLDQLPLDSLGARDLLLVITSTFGDGEPPGNALEFDQQLDTASGVSGFHYGVFALGDVAYANFCKFGRKVDESLQKLGARRLIRRVDADLDTEHFFSQWQACVHALLCSKRDSALDLDLQVKAYSAATPHKASVIAVNLLNSSEHPVYEVILDISGSGMHYCAGDLLYVDGGDDESLLADLAAWYGQPVDLLRGKELRTLSKSLLRKLASASGNDELKTLLKVSNKEALAEYMHGRDLFDVLKDTGPSGFIALEDLAQLLSARSPRAYSIASAGSQQGGASDQVSLCIRKVDYVAFGRRHLGSGSGALCNAKAGDEFAVFVRANAEFRLPANSDAGLIMIGAGTGIAPYMGFLEAQPCNNPRPAMLLFGERHYEQDFLYQQRLADYAKAGALTRLVTAFSRDSAAKYYVQDALLEVGAQVYAQLQQGAHLYVCGSKANLEGAIEKALKQIFVEFGKLSESAADQALLSLCSEQRLHNDLY